MLTRSLASMLTSTRSLDPAHCSFSIDCRLVISRDARFRSRSTTVSVNGHVKDNVEVKVKDHGDDTPTADFPDCVQPGSRLS
jgi:hypothetical protein